MENKLCHGLVCFVDNKMMNALWHTCTLFSSIKVKQPCFVIITFENSPERNSAGLLIFILTGAVPSEPPTSSLIESTGFFGVYGPWLHKKKKLGQNPAILTSCLVNTPYVIRLSGVQLRV